MASKGIEAVAADTNMPDAVDEQTALREAQDALLEDQELRLRIVRVIRMSSIAHHVPKAYTLSLATWFIRVCGIV